MRKRMYRTLFGGVVVAIALASPAQAQEFPSRAVRMVIPFPAGAGTNDIVGRFIADKLAKLWKQPVIPENRPGASGVIGATNVIRSAPNGYTMLWVSANYTMTPAVQELTFDAVKDLKSAAMVGTGSYMFIVGSHIKARSMQEFIAEAKTRELSYAGGTAANDLTALALMDSAGIKMKRVPYKGTNDSLMDLLGGRIELIGASSVGGVVDQVENGKIIPLAVTGPDRSALLPKIPAAREVGLQGAEVPSWWGIMVPANTPADIVQKINDAVGTVLKDEDTKQFMEKQNVTPKTLKPDEMDKIVRDEIEKYGLLTEKFGLKKEPL